MATGTVSTQVAHEGSRRRWLRRFANGLIALGIVVILYAGVILAWGDPVTWVWAHYQQRQLESQFNGYDGFAVTPTPQDDGTDILADVRHEACGLQGA